MQKSRHSIGFVQLALLNPPVGAARYARKVIKILSKKADITTYSFDGKARNELGNAEVVSILNAKKFTFPPLRFIMYLYAILKLTFMIRKHDALISFGDIENYMIFLNRFFINRNAKIVFEIHHPTGGLTFKEQWRSRNIFHLGTLTLLGNFLVNKFDAIITVSKFWKKRIHNFYKIPMHKIYIAYTGIEDVKKTSKKKLRIKIKHPIIYAGITTPIHNLELVVKSLPMIRIKFPDANLLLTGRRDENYFNKLIDLAKSLGVEDSIHHIGVVPEENLIDVYKKSDVAISVPLEEVGWSAILLKGILYKRPSIAIDRGALKEFIKRYDGIVVTNSPESFSGAVIKLLENKKVRKKIIENAYKTAKKDTWEKTAMVHLKCVNDIVNKR